MEYCGAGSMSDLMMKGRHPITEGEIRFLIAQILLGLSHLHSLNMIHRVCTGVFLECRTSKRAIFC